MTTHQLARKLLALPNQELKSKKKGKSRLSKVIVLATCQTINR